MTHENKQLRRWFNGAGSCEICLGHCHSRECFHVMAAGRSSGSRLDVRVNLLSSCMLCHRKWHDGNLEMDQSELFGLVRRRERLPPNCDLQRVLWCILNLPKDASLPQMSRSVALLPLHDRAVAWDVLREMKKVT